MANSTIRRAVRVSLVFLLAVTLFCPNIALAQGVPSWWGSAAWFDWSDYRATLSTRLFLAKLTSGTVTKNTSSTSDLVGGPFGITTDPELFAEFCGVFYVDRLGIRGNVETHKFVGRPADPTKQNLTKLDADFNRIGLDLDLIRYPFLKLGINGDYYFSDVRFQERLDTDTTIHLNYQSKEPRTIGIHAQAIPVRLRDVPVIAHARFRFPLPFMANDMARITDWEIGAGLRPAIWDTSMFGHSTFSVAIEAGYRSINLDVNAKAVDPLLDQAGKLLPNQAIDLKARWQGVFFQVEAFF